MAMKESDVRVIRRLWRFFDWLIFANVHRHWSLTCYGELPCDPRAHLSIGTLWALSEIL